MLQNLYDTLMKYFLNFYSPKKPRFKPKTGGRRLTVFMLATSLMMSGCGISQLKEREALLNSQQQQLAKQQHALTVKEQQLSDLETSLEQKANRLEVLKKDLRKNYDSNPNIYSSSLPIVIGAVEPVMISPPDLILPARIDTGATTSSLNALDMVEFERDGKPHIRFNIVNPETGEKVSITRRIIDRVQIKSHKGGPQTRPVVKIRMRLGDIDQRIRVTLTDRSKFEFQVLIGRNFLRDFAIVDVSQTFSTQPVIDTPE